MTSAGRLTLATRLLAILCLLPLLGGCFAAAAVVVPTMTAYAATKDHEARKRPAAAPVIAAPSPPGAPQVAADPSSRIAVRQAPAPAAGEAVRVDGGFKATVLPLTELPRPGAPAATASSGAPWRSFFSYALTQTKPSAAGDARRSAILSPESAVQMQPRRRTCQGEDSAVIIDLDPASGRFAPEAGLKPPPGLADELALLRQVGVIVMWISDLDTSRLDAIAAALVDSGLDPAGKDPILLAIGEGDRKQSLRQQAGQNACVVAIAGDDRTDFDELFAYLRDANAAVDFDPMLGSGWFLVPATLSSSAKPMPGAG